MYAQVIDPMDPDPDQGPVIARATRHGFTNVTRTCILPGARCQVNGYMCCSTFKRRESLDFCLVQSASHRAAAQRPCRIGVRASA
jgi:hypothetical protein